MAGRQFEYIGTIYRIGYSDGEGMRIAALTCRSFYSLLRGAVSVLRWVEKVAEYGYGAVALADVNSMSGVVDLCKAAGKTDVQPIIGVEILTDSQRAILLAEDRVGLRESLPDHHGQKP